MAPRTVVHNVLVKGDTDIRGTITIGGDLVVDGDLILAGKRISSLDLLAFLEDHGITAEPV